MAHTPKSYGGTGGVYITTLYTPPAPPLAGSDRLLTDAEAAAMFRRKPSTIARWRREGGLPYIKGRPCLVRMSVIVEYITNNLHVSGLLDTDNIALDTERREQSCSQQTRKHQSSQRTEMAIGKSDFPNEKPTAADGAVEQYRRAKLVSLRRRRS